MKYIIVTGGVISGLGKGITTSTIGLLLKKMELNVTALKIDPYLNIDAGTMSPYEHGECYVLNDGTETDLDLGNYERFLNLNLTYKSSITSGQIYNNVLKNERNGKYLGKTVQIIPHITNEIIERITNIDKKYDICLIELGGTVGDIESMPFIEALRQLQIKVGKQNIAFIHTTLLPTIHNNEMKTKPTQHSLQILRSLGIIPNFLCIRCSKEPSQNIINKLVLFSQIPSHKIIINRDSNHIYEVVQQFYNQNVIPTLCKELNIYFKKYSILDIDRYISFFAVKKNVKIIGILGKYTGLKDSYLSLIRAIEHASYIEKKRVHLIWISENENIDELEKKKVDAVVIPGGFGKRGIEKIIIFIKKIRELDIPCLGICLGMHLMIIEYFRNVLNIDCHSEEFITSEEQQKSKRIIKKMVPDKKFGGTLRKGLHKIKLKNNTKSYLIYGKEYIYERHRHRYCIDNKYIEIFNKNVDNKLQITGTSSNNDICEIIEIRDKKYYIGCQYHPEFLSRRESPHLLFRNLLKYINI